MSTFWGDQRLTTLMVNEPDINTSFNCEDGGEYDGDQEVVTVDGANAEQHHEG